MITLIAAIIMAPTTLIFITIICLTGIKCNLPDGGWNVWAGWAYAITCSAAFINTWVCVFFDRDNWFNAMCLTQDRKSDDNF